MLVFFATVFRNILTFTNDKGAKVYSINERCNFDTMDFLKLVMTRESSNNIWRLFLNPEDGDSSNLATSNVIWISTTCRMDRNIPNITPPRRKQASTEKQF